MATYFALLQFRNQPVEAIFAATDIAEENRVRECIAATKIQSMARMLRCRKRYLHLRQCILSMQRVYRGYVGRKRFFDHVHGSENVRQRAVFDHFATIIQRHFRGFYSRKWRSDFYSQKRYLQAIEHKSEAVRKEALEQREKQQQLLSQREQELQRAKFVETASDLHHLLSTAVRSGILRPALSQTGLTTVFGTNVEDELRVAALESLKTRKFKREIIPVVPPVKGGSPVKKFTIGGGKYVQSMQASVPYDTDGEAKLLAKAVDSKMAMQFHNAVFVARKAAPPPHPKSLNAESEYLPGSTRR
jgi:hypothetical protein